jgi:6-phosphogluconolactonase
MESHTKLSQLPKTVHLEIASTRSELAAHAVNLITHAAQKANMERTIFRLVLSGGSTPLETYKLLAINKASHEIDWARTQVFWSDERMVEPQDADSNYLMASTALLQHLDIPEANIFRMRGELTPEMAEKEYIKQLARAFNNLPVVFDLVLLGMGADGHTASLFPGTEFGELSNSPVKSQFVDHLNSWRISLSMTTLLASRETIFLVQGKDKAERLANVLEYSVEQADTVPSAYLVANSINKVTFLVDRDAASQLSDSWLAGQQ